MTDLNSKPEIDFPEGAAPEQLEITDVVVGDGAEAIAGATVDVHYLGVEFASGDEFDSSWNRGQSINFPLRSLIAGWQEGIPGMKVGGRRKLVVPPSLRPDPGLRHRPARRQLNRVTENHPERDVAAAAASRSGCAVPVARPG